VLLLPVQDAIGPVSADHVVRARRGRARAARQLPIDLLGPLLGRAPRGASLPAAPAPPGTIGG
jgi:hypothetical protein